MRDRSTTAASIWRFGRAGRAEPERTAPALAARWWQWPTIASLDAPIVALAWQAFIAGVSGVSLSATHRFVLGASVWLAYAADRWMEAARLPAAQLVTPRHRFHQRYRWPILGLWLAVLTADVTAACATLTARELGLGLLLLGSVAAYLFLHQLLHRGRAGRPPKEICVALLLAGGVALFVAPRAVGPWTTWALPLGWFAWLCFANCALISVWEREVDAVQGQISIARQFARGPALAGVVPWLICAVSGGLLLVPGAPGRLAAACAFVSGALLGGIDRAEHALGWRAARVLADAALLTPLVPLLAGGLGHA